MLMAGPSTRKKTGNSEQQNENTRTVYKKKTERMTSNPTKRILN